VPGHSQTRGVEKMFRKIRLRCSPISCSVLAALGQSSASGTGMSRALGTDREERSGRRRRCGSLRSHTHTHARDRAHTHTYNQVDALSVQHKHAFEELVQACLCVLSPTRDIKMWPYVLAQCGTRCKEIKRVRQCRVLSKVAKEARGKLNLKR
jgi:hypothetical protein